MTEFFFYTYFFKYTKEEISIILKFLKLSSLKEDIDWAVHKSDSVK